MSKSELLTLSVMLLVVGAAVDIAKYFNLIEQWTWSNRMEPETVEIPAIFQWNGLAQSFSLRLPLWFKFIVCSVH